MRRIPLLALGLTAALVALAPDGPKDPTIGTSYRVPYRVTDTNHFLVRVRLNGKGPFNFLVDTGAPALFVSTDAAKAAGLSTPKGEFWAPIDRLDFEGGAALKDVKGRIEDPFQLTSMNALGLPGASIDGILGFTMLARFKIELDPTRDRMVWTRLDYEPQEPFIPKGATSRQAPAEVEAMNLLGPLAKGMAALIGKQEPDRLIPRGRVGVLLEPAEGGVKVAGVLEGSPAATAGLKAGDIVVAIDGKAVATPSAATAAVAMLRPGKTVALKVRRGGESTTRDIIAGEGF